MSDQVGNQNVGFLMTWLKTPASFSSIASISETRKTRFIANEPISYLLFHNNSLSCSDISARGSLPIMSIKLASSWRQSSVCCKNIISELSQIMQVFSHNQSISFHSQYNLRLPLPFHSKYGSANIYHAYNYVHFLRF